MIHLLQLVVVLGVALVLGIQTSSKKRIVLSGHWTDNVQTSSPEMKTIKDYSARFDEGNDVARSASEIMQDDVSSRVKKTR
mmetsp:Transcript_20181/g.34387  ORF Transcript_20181/g.34387 Transcript_20181/m.34387 type:complete len:81 (+) Transcript_20181:709-951(+)